MGYWAEMNVLGFSFWVSIDGVTLKPDVDISDRKTLSEATLTAIETYKMIYPIIEDINCGGVQIQDETDATVYLRKLEDLSFIWEIIDFLKPLRTPSNSKAISLPREIDLVLDTAYEIQRGYRSFKAKQKPLTVSRSSRDTSGYVYLIQSPSGNYKIGRTKNPEDRMKTFSVKLPFEADYLHLIPADNYIVAEKTLQSRFAGKRIAGEWFALDSEDVAYIRSIQSM